MYNWGEEGAADVMEGRSSYVVPSMADLTMAELRSRLTMLGEGTATPGLSGDERRAELIKRLMRSIVREEQEDSETDIMDDIVHALEEKTPPNAAAANIAPPQAGVGEESNEVSIERKLESMRKQERIKTTELREVKKRLNALVNRRSAVISARFAGPKQDSRLGETCRECDNIESEIARIHSLRKKSDKTGKKSNLSSALVDGGNSMSSEKLLLALEKTLNSTKEKIKRQKLRIRCEEEASDLHGLEAEDCEQQRVQSLSFEISKIKRDMEKVKAGHVTICAASAIEEDEVCVSVPVASSQAPPISKADNVAAQCGTSSAKYDTDAQPKATKVSREMTQKKTKHAHNLELIDSDLQALKPFKPYNDDEDDVLTMKMEMLRNRHRADKAVAMRTMEASSAAAATAGNVLLTSREDSSRSVAIGKGSDKAGAFSAFRPSGVSSASGSRKIGEVKRIDATEEVSELAAVGFCSSDDHKDSHGDSEFRSNDDDSDVNDDDGEMESSDDDDDTGEEENEGGNEKTADEELDHSGKDDGVGDRHSDVKKLQAPAIAEHVAVKASEVVLSQKPSFVKAALQSGNFHQRDDDEDMDNVDVGSEDDDEEDEDEILQQVKALRDHAVVLQRNGNFEEVENLYVRALELHPTDMRTLDLFATFLHRKKGEMGRAEAFYRRAIQVGLPSLVQDLHTTPREGVSPIKDWKDPVAQREPSSHDLHELGNRGVRVKALTHLLLNYATFLRRARGDLETAEVVLRRAAEISPTNAVVLGTCAHHLAEEACSHLKEARGGSSDLAEKYCADASDMFTSALRVNPTNVTNILWYAKFLHKTRKYAQAEVMYKVAMQNSKDSKHEATTICNYAVFLFRNKKNPEEAATLFCKGLDRFPHHRGLVKNFKALKKELQKSCRLNEHRPPDPDEAATLPAIPEVEDAAKLMESPRGADRNAVGSQGSNRSGNGGGMKAKLYRDIDSASAVCAPLPATPCSSERKLSDQRDLLSDIGEMNIDLVKVVCSQLNTASSVYWTVQWGDGSSMDKSFQSDEVQSCSSGGSCEWEFNMSCGPNMMLTLDDHLCFEFYQGPYKNGPQEHGRFLGSVIYPAEDLLLEDRVIGENLYHIEEPIGHDDGATIGHLDVYVKINRA